MPTPTDLRRADPRFPAFFRHRALAGGHLITGLAGRWAVLDDAEWQAFVEGRVDPASETWETLRRGGFIRAEVDVDDLAARLRRKKAFLGSGPNLHIVVTTLRCNETCAYCHASRADLGTEGVDLTAEVAEQVVDRILETTSPDVTIEFQGGEPLVNWPVVRHLVDYALEKNRVAGKSLEFTLVSNLAAMDEEKLAFLLGHKVQVCTSVDGPAPLHNKQRVLAGGDAHATALRWIKRLNEAYRDEGLDPEVYHVEALPTVTRAALADPEGLIDTYLELGCKAIYLRRLDPFGFAAKTRAKLGYSVEEFLEFYRRALDHIIELNLKGTRILERTAAIFLTKILTPDDPNFLDIRSPCGAGIGQLAYNYDGSVFTCDEGRMLHEMGDDMFVLGHVGTGRYRDFVGHDTVKNMILASDLDASPDCADCAYNPYCGICPVYNYATQGSLHGQMRRSDWCAGHMGIQDHLFGKLAEGDPAVREVFRRWVEVRPRDHYLHEAES